MPWTFDGSQFVGSFATTWIDGVERRLLALLPAERQRVPGEAAEEGDVAGLDLRVHHVRERLAELARVLADHRRVVRARAGHVAPGVGRHGDSGLRRLLEHRDHGVAEVGVGDDRAHVLRDHRLEVRDRLVQVGVCAHVDDLPDLGIRERLEDELHLRHLAVGVLAEALDVRDGELAARSGAAAVVLPALERQRVVDRLRRPSECSQRDVAPRLVRRQQVRLEERVCEGGRRRLVALAVAASLPDHGASLPHIARGAGGGRVRAAGAAARGRDERDRCRSRDEQHRKDLALPSHP